MINDNPIIFTQVTFLRSQIIYFNGNYFFLLVSYNRANMEKDDLFERTSSK